MNSDPADLEQPFLSHLLELRDRLLRSVVAVALAFLVLFPFSNEIYVFVAEPLMKVLPEGTHMIATKVASPFLTPFKLSLVAAIFLSMPFLLYQLWAFVAPGLYQHERRMALPLLASSVVLFYLGAAFAYFVVFPLVFRFFTSVTPEGVAVATDIAEYLDFVLTLFFAFGLAFEIPIATIILVWMGMTTPEKLASKRPYIVVGVFVVGMLLTPPDVISQTLLAVPMWLLFEAGVFFSRFFVRNEEHSKETVQEEHEPAADDEAFRPLTEEEMEQELDRIEAEESDLDPVDAKLVRVNELREAMDFDAARRLLYEVLAEGDEAQVRTARNILQQLDELDE